MPKSLLSLLGALLAALCLLTTVVRATDAPATTREKLLVGVWQTKDPVLFGGFEGYSVVKTDGTVCQIGHVLKADKWLFFEVSWKIVNDKTVAGKIIRSNLPNVPAGATSGNEIVSLDEKTYTYIEQSGTKRTETRVDALPEEFKKKLEEFQKTVPVPTPAPAPAP